MGRPCSETADWSVSAAFVGYALTLKFNLQVSHSALVTMVMYPDEKSPSFMGLKAQS